MAKAGRLYLQLDVNYHEDARLVDVSPLAELLYIRCLCACKRLATNGELSNTQIARIGYDIARDDGVDALTRELLSVGLLEGEHDAWMTVPAWASWNEVAEAISAARAASGRVGGMRSGEARRERSNLLHDDEANTKQAPNQTKHSRVEKSRVEKSTRVASIEAEFDAWWAEYPRKISRKAALKSYTAQRNKGVSADTLMTAVKNYAEAMVKENRPDDRILYGSTFLGPTDRWEDYQEKPMTVTTKDESLAGAGPMFANETEREAFYASVSLGKVELDG